MKAEATAPPPWHRQIEAATDRMLELADRRALDPVNRRARIFEALELALLDPADDPPRRSGESLSPWVFRSHFWDAASRHGGEGMPADWWDAPAVADEIRAIVARRVEQAGGSPPLAVDWFGGFPAGAVELPGPAFGP